MRRFLIRNATGDQIGEGVEWSNGAVVARLDAERGSVSFANAASEIALAFGERGLSIDWLDPERGATPASWSGHRSIIESEFTRALRSEKP